MSENLSITQLRTFLWVASLGSFRKTAEKMNTTQPAISSRIAKLEEILGARLFDRDTGTIQITPEGEALRPHAEGMIKTAERLSGIVKGQPNETGVVQLGVTEYAVLTWLPNFLESLPKVFPNVEVVLTISDTASLRRDLLSRELDAAVLLGPINDQRISNIEFSTCDYCWAAAPSTGLKADIPYNVIDLIRFPIITGAKISALYMEFVKYLKKSDLDGYRIYPSISYSAARELAISGTGISILPESYVDATMDKGELIKLTCDWTPAPLIFTGSYTESPQNPLAEKIIYYAKSLII